MSNELNNPRETDMPVKLVDEDKQGIILACDLKNGQIGVMQNSYPGRIVQRFGDSLVSIGLPYGRHFSGNCQTPVRILQPGDRIEITD